MSEVPALARRLGEAVERGAALALATVVSTEGSTYRRAGAWMAIDPDGSRQGQVSGGCLEADIVERAAAVLARGLPEIVTYDTRHPDDLIWGFGLGCQGIVRVLVEPLQGDRLRRMATFFARAAEITEPAVLVTTISGDSGARFLVTTGEVISSGTAPLAAEIARDARRRLAAAEPGGARVYDGGLEVGFENLYPRTRLILCGAGDDAIPLAKLAAELDWSVLVIDHRAAWAVAGRFPAARVEWIESPRGLPALLGVPHARTAAVVMSHNFDCDARYAAALLPLGLPYLGLLGPRKRGEQILATVEDRPDRPRSAAVFSPVGLDIASETPREIALAIIAEISAVLAGRSGGPLKDKAAAAIREAASRVPA